MATQIQPNQQGDVQQQIRIVLGSIALDGDLSVPFGAHGIVLFAHGSGSSRFSPRNRYVADVLREAKLGTLLMDLLTAQEEQADKENGQFRFDIGLLAQRLIGVTHWLTQNADTRRLNIGYFGASTGAGAALLAASQRPDVVKAVVSRGGRPDLAGQALNTVKAPTLLIVGGQDSQVILLNTQALARIQAVKSLEIIPGAGHLFEEPGTLEQVAYSARQWFERFLNVKAAEKAHTR